MTNIVFSHVSRERPIVLTAHQVDSLSQVAGRDVRQELVALSKEGYCAKTLGQLMRWLAVRLIGSQPAAEGTDA